MGREPIMLLAAIVAMAVGVAGCGGGGDSTTNTNPISKAAFIGKADAICQKSNERMGHAFLSFLNKHKEVKQPSKAEYEKLVGTVLVPSVEREIKEVKALGVPEGDEDAVNAMIKALEEGVETAEDNPEAVTSSSEVVFGIASRLAGEYGLKVCGSR
jgi:hypothetical protein